MKQTSLNIIIPFSGFYDSMHSNNLDRGFEDTFNNDQDQPYSQRLSERAYDLVDWTNAHVEYTKEYVEAFNSMFNLQLQFDELSRPREYNFTTDRIFCKITYDEVARMFSETDKSLLERVITERFTSRDGFISFYFPDVHRWPYDLREWDHNQLGALMTAYVEQEAAHEEDFEWNLSEDIETWNIIGNNIKDDRIWTLLTYLRNRVARAYLLEDSE